jgi:hypothetical protein
MRNKVEKLKYGVLFGLGKVLSSLYFFKPFRSKQEQLNSIPFFIVGSGRNGSTLLASTLTQYENIHIPPEQFALPYSIMKYRLFNFLSWNFLQKMIENDFFDSKKTSNWQVKREQSQKTASGLREILDSIYNSSSTKKHILWGDKTPQNTYFLKHIYPVYPDAKYIFLLRDGRDVVSSLLKMMRVNKKHQEFTDKQLVDQAIFLWNESIVQYDWLQSKSADIMLVRYEDFVTKPDEVVDDIVAYLGVKKGMLTDFDKADAMGVGEMEHHQNLRKPISPKSIGKWKSELTKEQLAYILPRINDNLSRFSYS